MRYGHTLASMLICCAALCACGGPTAAPQNSQTGSEPQLVEVTEQVDADEHTQTEEQATQPTSTSTTTDPHTLPAGAVVLPQSISKPEDVDRFFWAEEIPDEVFARMEGHSFGPDCTLDRSELRYVRVLHVDAQGSAHVGELVVNVAVADEVVDIFRQLYDARYPIKKMHLVDDYGADDFASCTDGNTSAFNYRTIAGSTQLSNHALGLAIDINTFENPYCIPSSGYVFPPEAEHYANRDLDEPYMTHPGDACYNLFAAYGWSWGGDWESPKDYQHFEKPL